MAKNKPTVRSRYSKAAIKVRRQIKRATGRTLGKRIIERYEGEFPTLRELGGASDEDLKLLTKHAEGLLKTGTLTLRHQRQMRQAIETLVSLRYDFDPNDYEALWDFFDDAEASGLAHFYGYEHILTKINKMRRQKLTDEEIRGNIDYWTKKAKEAKEKGKKLKALRIRRGRRGSSNDFRRK